MERYSHELQHTNGSSEEDSDCDKFVIAEISGEGKSDTEAEATKRPDEEGSYMDTEESSMEMEAVENAQVKADDTEEEGNDKDQDVHCCEIKTADTSEEDEFDNAKVFCKEVSKNCKDLIDINKRFFIAQIKFKKQLLTLQNKVNNLLIRKCNLELEAAENSQEQGYEHESQIADTEEHDIHRSEVKAANTKDEDGYDEENAVSKNCKDLIDINEGFFTVQIYFKKQLLSLQDKVNNLLVQKCTVKLEAAENSQEKGYEHESQIADTEEQETHRCEMEAADTKDKDGNNEENAKALFKAVSKNCEGLMEINKQFLTAQMNFKDHLLTLQKNL